MPETKNRTEADSSYEQGLIAASQQVKSVEGVPALLIPTGYTLKTFDHWLERPKHLEGDLRFRTVKALVDYGRRFGATGASMLFSTNVNQPRYLAIFDYHDDAKRPRHCLHRGVLQIDYSLEYKNWRSQHKESFSQVPFAEFIEDNQVDIIDPPGAQMLEIALSLRAKTNITFNSAQRLQNGAVEFQYNEEIKGQAGPAGKLEIPERFTIAVPIFEGEQREELFCNFRYRIQQGRARLWYEIVRPERAERAAVDRISEALQKGLPEFLFIEGEHFETS